MFATRSQEHPMARMSSAMQTFFQLGLTIAAVLLLIGVINTFAASSQANTDETHATTVSAFSLWSEMPAEIPTTEPPGETLTPRMQAALEHISQRYRVSGDALAPIFEAAQASGRERSLDPLLIVAIIGIESGFNPFAESTMGAQGLMQVIPRFHQDKVPEGAGKLPLLDPVTNVRIGSHVLQEAIRLRGGLMAGLQQFGGAMSDAEQAYATKVLAEKQRLEQIAARRSGATSA